LLAALCFLLACCEPRDVVVFELDGADELAAGGAGSASTANAGGSGATAGLTVSTGGDTASGGTDASGAKPLCSTDADCAASEFCVKADCAASSGSCVPPPVFCDAGPDPVCGCDQITYWNDCIRQQNRVAASSAGECRAGSLRCDSAADCGASGISCAHLLPPNVDCTLGPPMSSGPPQALMMGFGNHEGTCWALPDCSAVVGLDTMRWTACARGPQDPMQQSPLLCVDTCAAILSGGVFARVGDESRSRCQ
jgi:hypothetical protein